jgi:hypothetical protein
MLYVGNGKLRPCFGNSLYTLSRTCFSNKYDHLEASIITFPVIFTDQSARASTYTTKLSLSIPSISFKYDANNSFALSVSSP